MSFSLGSDNHSGAHPAIIKALSEINVGHCHSYGLDAITEKAKNVLQSEFGPCDVYFVFNGTAANVLSIHSLVERHQSVLCTEVAHINVDECGAPEALVGCKLVPVRHSSGKFDLQDLRSKLVRFGDQHFSQVKMISITQPTEYGTVYSLAEIEEIARIAKEHKLFLHLDGARLVYAPQALKSDLKNITKHFDVVALGGTKNGALGAEAVLVFNEAAKTTFKFKQKQFMQLSSKTRFIGQQFTTLFSRTGPHALWEELARRNHDLALYLAEKLSHIPQVKVTQPVQANAVFATLPPAWIKLLREKYFFYVWDQFSHECRFMISFDTPKEFIDEFVAAVAAHGKIKHE